MQPPNPKAPFETWQAWCDANYPYAGYKPLRDGFEVLRGIEDPQLRVDVAQALARIDEPQAVARSIPPMPEHMSPTPRSAPISDRAYEPIFGYDD